CRVYCPTVSTRSCPREAPSTWLRARTSRAAARSRAVGRLEIWRMGGPPRGSAAGHRTVLLPRYFRYVKSQGGSAEHAAAGQQVLVDGPLDGVADLIGQVEQHHRVQHRVRAELRGLGGGGRTGQPIPTRV